MSSAYRSLVVKDFDRLFRHGTAPSGDAALLACFIARGDEAAFEALVARHGPMVRGVCSRLLIDSHDADDAFQATFLVLLRKAKYLRDADRLGPWLYGVATRVASKARAQASRRRDRNGLHVEDVSGREGPALEWLDLMPILDTEMGRLPAKFRDVLVLCLLEGATAEEASRRLACPLGTVKSRLARGREALRARLVSRGVAPAVALTAVSSVFASPVSAALTRATMETIASSANPASLAPGVVALTRGAAPSMFPKSTVMASLILGGMALAGLGLTTWIKAPALAQDNAPGAEPARNAPAAGGDERASAQTMNHLKMILLAFHNYNDANNHLPPSAIYGADGQPKLSWRVALLPYLDQADLYNQFKQDEPWDSPHNRALIAKMPDVFRTPNSPAQDGWTRIRGFAGRGAMFDGVAGLRLADITDGTSNTALVAVASDPVTWTQPGDLPFAEGQPLPALQHTGGKGHLIGMADGSVRYIPHDFALLRNLITRAGNEIIQWPEVMADPTTARPAATPAPAPTAAPPLRPTPAPAMPPSVAQGLEQRLQRLEDKVDRILRMLESLPGRDEGRKP